MCETVPLSGPQPSDAPRVPREKHPEPRTTQARHPVVVVPSPGKGLDASFAAETSPSGPRVTRAARNPPSRLVPPLERRGLSGGGVAEAGEAQSRDLANVLKRLGDSVQRAQPSRCPLKVWGRPCPHKVPAWGQRPPFGTPRLGPQTTQSGEARPEWPAPRWKLLLEGGPDASALPGRRATGCRRFTASLEEKFRRPL